MPIQLALTHTLGASKGLPLLLTCLKRFLGPLGDQIPLDLGDDRKGHSDDLALDASVKTPIALDRIDVDTLLSRHLQDLNTL